MVTVRLLERLWNTKAYGRIAREVLGARPEASLRMEMELNQPSPAAAIMLIRLDELSQSSVPLYGKLVRTIVSQQQSDGGWGDLMSTALCIRALLCGSGQGTAIDAGLAYLANLQKDDGSWPAAPLRRMPADAYISAFILLQLGDRLAFQEAVRFDQAMDWFEDNQQILDAQSRALWQLAEVRSKPRYLARGLEAPLWS